MATTKQTTPSKKVEPAVQKSASAKTAPAAASVSPPVAKKKKPTTEEIAKKAYEIYLRRGGTHGSDQDDWLHAETELLSGK